jgi:DNA (cytosine-5)-methyltransferase 1
MPATSRPLLSVFPGIDLLGRGFEAEGFCVVRGPDLVWGGDILDFHPPHGVFAGIIGGPPCPDFSKKRRCPPTGNGVAMLREFARCVTEAGPDWFLMENVLGVPDVEIPGYTIQRFNLNAAECGGNQHRPRRFQFGSLDGRPLVPHRGIPSRGLSQCVLASEGKQPRRTWADVCELQGLPRAFELPGMSRAAKYRAVGNGVPVYMARVIAVAVKRRLVTPKHVRLCVCECGRVVDGNRVMATAGCRKRMQRKRDAAAVTIPGMVTSGMSPVTLPASL